MAQSIQEKREERRRRREEEGNSDESEKGITESKGRATPSRRRGEVGRSGGSGGNAVTRWFGSVRDYFEGVQSELEKVTWPTREETNRLTRIVVAVLIASALFLGGLSILFTEIFNLGVNQPWVFIVVFFAFLGVLAAYARFASSNSGPEY